MENLRSKTVRELVELARQWGVTGYSKMKKAELVKLLSKRLLQESGKTDKAQKKKESEKAARTSPAKARKAAARARARSPAGTGRKKAAKAATKALGKSKQAPGAARRHARPKKGVVPSGSRSVPKGQRRILPTGYGDGRMVLVARDPHWLYVYWDLTEEQEARLRAAKHPLLRVVELKRLQRARELGRIRIKPDARSWYLRVDTAGASYRAELGILDKSGRFQVVLSSNSSRTPRADRSDNDAAVFARFMAGQEPVPALAPPGRAEVHTERLYALSAGEAEPGLDSASALGVRERVSSWDRQSRRSESGR